MYGYTQACLDGGSVGLAGTTPRDPCSPPLIFTGAQRRSTPARTSRPSSWSCEATSPTRVRASSRAACHRKPVCLVCLGGVRACVWEGHRKPGVLGGLANPITTIPPNTFPPVMPSRPKNPGPAAAAAAMAGKKAVSQPAQPQPPPTPPPTAAAATADAAAAPPATTTTTMTTAAPIPLLPAAPALKPSLSSSSAEAAPASASAARQRRQEEEQDDDEEAPSMAVPRGREEEAGIVHVRSVATPPHSTALLLFCVRHGDSFQLLAHPIPSHPVPPFLSSANPTQPSAKGSKTLNPSSAAAAGLLVLPPPPKEKSRIEAHTSPMSACCCRVFVCLFG